jgi:hypothetical protein
MKTKCLVLVTSALGALIAPLHAGPRTSANYNIVTDTLDDGGKRMTSLAYTNDGSIGAIAGIATVAAPAETAKSGYIGQLFEVTGLVLEATPLTLNEGGTRQLNAALLLDDSTTLAVNAPSVAWSVLSGPLTSINASGLATAGTVYQSTGATAQGIHAGNTGTLNLTVLDSIPDNFGSYAGDGLGDDWQVQHFGLDNPNAAPGLDPDGDGENNHFEFTAGVIPTDPASRFVLRIEPVPAQPMRKNLIFSPRLGDRTYTVEFRSELTIGNWATLPGTTQSDNGQERTVTDLNATGSTKFYRVQINKP